MEDESLIVQSIKNYCNYQERCHSEVRYKLIALGARGESLEEILTTLIDEGLLNEERFARSYVRGKFRNNQWGRKKIMQALKEKQVSAYCIKQGLKEISEDEYLLCITRLIEKKVEILKTERHVGIRKQKVLRYLLQRGFEYELANKAISNIF